jgi:hypothetical protein
MEVRTVSLPLGFWTINANGFSGSLLINAVDAQGNLSGLLKFFADQPGETLDGVGFWDDTSKKITFMRIIDRAKPSTFQIFTGYLFPDDHTQPAGGQKLAGYFEAFSGTGGVAQRVLYGWFASSPLHHE